jgi:hypothetical protein
MDTYFSSGTFIDNDIKKLQEIEDKESHNNESRYCPVVESTNHEGDKSKIKSKEILESEVRNELVKRAYGSKEQLIHWNYNLDKHIGYFMLEVNKDVR